MGTSSFLTSVPHRSCSNGVTCVPSPWLLTLLKPEKKTVKVKCWCGKLWCGTVCSMHWAICLSTWWGGLYLLSVYFVLAAWCPCSNRLHEGLPVSWPPCMHRPCVWSTLVWVYTFISASSFNLVYHRRTFVIIIACGLTAGQETVDHTCPWDGFSSGGWGSQREAGCEFHALRSWMVLWIPYTNIL